MTVDSAVRPAVHVSGPLSVVDAALADHAEAVVREAVSNVVRHAAARSVTVAVTVDDDLTIGVSDDGVGISEDVDAAAAWRIWPRGPDECGGQFTIAPRPGGGTRLVWSAPLPLAEPQTEISTAGCRTNSCAAVPLDEQRDELADAGAVEPVVCAVHGLADDVIRHIGEQLGQAVDHLIDLALLLSTFHAGHHRTKYAVCATTATTAGVGQVSAR